MLKLSDRVENLYGYNLYNGTIYLSFIGGILIPIFAAIVFGSVSSRDAKEFWLIIFWMTLVGLPLFALIYNLKYTKFNILYSLIGVITVLPMMVLSIINHMFSLEALAEVSKSMGAKHEREKALEQKAKDRVDLQEKIGQEKARRHR